MNLDVYYNKSSRNNLDNNNNNNHYDYNYNYNNNNINTDSCLDNNIYKLKLLNNFNSLSNINSNIYKNKEQFVDYIKNKRISISTSNTNNLKVFNNNKYNNINSVKSSYYHANTSNSIDNNINNNNNNNNKDNNLTSNNKDLKSNSIKDISRFSYIFKDSNIV